MSMVGHPMLERLQGVRPMPATKEDRRRAEAEARAAAEAAAPAAAQVKRRPCPSKEYAEHSCRQLLKARRRYRRPWWSPVAAGACLGSCLRSPSRLCLARPAVGLGVVMQVRRGTQRDSARAQCRQQQPASAVVACCCAESADLCMLNTCPGTGMEGCLGGSRPAVYGDTGPRRAASPARAQPRGGERRPRLRSSRALRTARPSPPRASAARASASRPAREQARPRALRVLGRGSSGAPWHATGPGVLGSGDEGGVGLLRAPDCTGRDPCCPAASAEPACQRVCMGVSVPLHGKARRCSSKNAV